MKGVERLNSRSHAVEAFHDDAGHAPMMLLQNGLKVFYVEVAKDLSSSRVDVCDVLAKDTVLCVVLVVP